jgi:hydroxyacylglutathione hydrolase
MEVFLKRIKNEPIDSNNFILYQPNTNKCIVIDPGTSDCKELLGFLYENSLEPQLIILTHEHFDHIWGVNKLKDTFDCKVVCSGLCSGKISDKKKNMSLFYDQIGFKSYPGDILVEDIKYVLEWNDVKIEFIAAKGHTDAGICLIISDMLFTGDTMILNHKTVTKFPGGSREDLSETLDLLFSGLTGRNLKVFPGHGEPFFFDKSTKSDFI